MVNEKALLIFDGDCGFCTSSANWIVKHSKTEVVAKPWQRIDVTEHGLLIPQVQSRVYLVRDGHNYGGNAAIAELAKMQGNPVLWFLGWLSMVPPFCLLSSLTYRLVARYRHKLPGGTPACKL